MRGQEAIEKVRQTAETLQGLKYPDRIVSAASTRICAPLEIKYETFNVEQALVKVSDLGTDEVILPVLMANSLFCIFKVAGVLRLRRDQEQGNEPNPGSAGK